MELQTEGIFEALRGPLALIEEDERRQMLERYLGAVRVPLERAVFDMLAEMVGGIEEQVGEQYTLRLTYQPGTLSLEVEPNQRDAPDDEAVDWGLFGGETEKITIRIPAELKELITAAAAGSGLSANNWFIRVLARSLRAAAHEGRDDEHDRRREAHEERRRGRRDGKQLRGWIGGE